MAADCYTIFKAPPTFAGENHTVPSTFFLPGRIHGPDHRQNFWPNIAKLEVLFPSLDIKIKPWLLSKVGMEYPLALF